MIKRGFLLLDILFSDNHLPLIHYSFYDFMPIQKMHNSEEVMNIEILKSADIDYDSGVERFSGLDAVYQKFLRMFPEDPSYNSTIDAIKNEDYENAFTYAHTLKGTAGNLSLSELYRTTSLLVEDLRVKKTDNLTTRLAEVTESYKKTTEAIKKASADE